MRNSDCTRPDGRGPRALALLAALAAALAWIALAPNVLSAHAASSGAGGSTGSAAPKTTGAGAPKLPASATLEECTTSAQQAERAVTFSGEMSTIPGTAKMEIRIDLLERATAEPAFHTVTAAGLGVWRVAAQGVKNYRYLKQVTNLAAPAYYRGAVRFRWLNAKGKLIKSAELRTARCLQTVLAPEAHPGSEVPTKGA